MSTLPGGSALVIGIDGYSGGVSPLSSAVRDARAIAAALEQQHGYTVTVLVDADATGSGIVSAIDTLAAGLNEDRFFVLYFAGHGIARGDGDGGPEGFIIPFDGKPGASDSWISMSRLRSALEALPSRHLLAVLDCCFAGSFRWAATRAISFHVGPLYDSQYERFLRGTSWQAITSASYDETALDVAPGRENHRDGATAVDGHSPFAAALLRGLAGTADTARAGEEPDGVMTATELYQYVFDELVPSDGGAHQTPGIWPLRPDNKGEFIFHNPDRDKQTVPDPPLDDENNPWQGLTAYSRDDAPLFFGRERVVDALLDRVLDNARPKLLAVVGASGTGKSSVVKAGLLALLSDPPEERAADIGAWTIVQSPRLRGDPGRQLDTCIGHLQKAAAGTRKLLFIDQFEELYTRCPESEQRAEYLRRLREIIDADNDTIVVLTLRSDFEPRPAASDAMKEIWQAARYLVPALTSEEFRDCIIGPAQVKAMYFEPDELVGELLDEVMAMPGALPMLSFALSEMYQRARARRRETGATDRALTRADYTAAGGVVGALHRRAEKLYDDADADSQRTIRRLFLRMLSQQGGQLTRRRIDLDEIEYADEAEQARVKRVVARYVEARLLVIDGNEIEPAHDTIVVAWDKLLEWLSNAGPLSLYRAWWNAASDWNDNARSKALLWDDDPRLRIATKYRDEGNRLESAFMSASLKRRRNVRTFRIATLATVIVGMLIGIGWAQRQQLLREEVQARAALSEQEAALARGQAELAAEDARLAEEKAALADEQARLAQDREASARIARDNLYLGLLERGNFFRVEDVLGADAQAGVLEPIDTQAWSLLVADDGAPFVIARPYEKGRVMAIGHESLLTYVENALGDALFVEIALEWLSGGEDTRIALSEGHLEALRVFHPGPRAAWLDRLAGHGYEILEIDNLASPGALEHVDMIIVANAWEIFTDAEIDAVDGFVAGGGGLLAAGLGWSWIDTGWPQFLARRDAASPADIADASLALENYPMNRLMAPFAMHWVDGSNDFGRQ